MADQSIRGRFVWHELMTPDTAGAHRSIEGVSAGRRKAGPRTRRIRCSWPAAGRWRFRRATEQCAELASLRRHDTMSPATVEQARSLGGTVVKGLDEHAERRHVRVLSDPAGSEFGAYTSPDEPGPGRFAQAW